MSDGRIANRPLLGCFDDIGSQLDGMAVGVKAAAVDDTVDHVGIGEELRDESRRGPCDDVLRPSDLCDGGVATVAPDGLCTCKPLSCC